MDSIVLELQRKALDNNTDAAELVRMALVVARKLRLKDLEQWCALELNGYRNEELPAYRIIRAEIKAHNPYHGWVPVVFENADRANALARSPCAESIAQLQDMVSNRKEGGILYKPFRDEIVRELMRGYDVPLVPTRLISVTLVVGILDAVRNTILEWALELEQNEILGEGLTFSPAEKEKAASASSVQITNFHGVLGDVHVDHVQIGDYNSIHDDLKRLGIPQSERNVLENILDEYKASKGDKKQTLARRGLDWAAKHAGTLGKLAAVIHGWFKATD